MKNLSLLVMITYITATISCKKETVMNDKVQNAVSQNVSSAVSNGTKFGAWIATGTSSANQVTVGSKLGVDYMRTTVVLTQFKGKIDMFDKCIQNGKKVLLNLNYGVGGRSIPFPKDMNKYRQLLGNVLSKYKPEVAVIENEPTTEQFHKGPISDYIAMLRVAIDVCHQHGVKVADGAIHAENVQLVMKGGRLTDNAQKVKTLIAAYRTMNLDYVNVHTKGKGNSYPAGQLPNVANYLRNNTGHPVMSNEWHLENNSASLMRSMVSQWKAGNYVYSVCLSSDNSAHLFQGTSLTSLGIAYRDAIH